MKKSLLFFSILLILVAGCKENNSIVEPTNQNGITSLAKINNTFSSKLYWIDGSVGGKINVAYHWINSKGQCSKLYANLVIPANAFSGIEKFNMVFNLEKNYVSLFPSPKSFKKPLLFSCKLKNVNVEYPDLDFKYLDGNESVVYESNKVDVNNRILEVRRAQLHHFSDWGWER